jgi:hypothetical protein
MQDGARERTNAAEGGLWRGWPRAVSLRRASGFRRRIAGRRPVGVASSALGHSALTTAPKTLHLTRCAAWCPILRPHSVPPPPRSARSDFEVWGFRARVLCDGPDFSPCAGPVAARPKPSALAIWRWRRTGGIWVALYAARSDRAHANRLLGGNPRFVIHRFREGRNPHRLLPGHRGRSECHPGAQGEAGPVLTLQCRAPRRVENRSAAQFGCTRGQARAASGGMALPAGPFRHVGAVTEGFRSLSRLA